MRIRIRAKSQPVKRFVFGGYRVRWGLIVDVVNTSKEV